MKKSIVDVKKEFAENSACKKQIASTFLLNPSFYCYFFVTFSHVVSFGKMR